MAIVDVIKYNGEPDVFAWKYPNEELGTWTQLIVHESQEALLFKGGQAFDLFSSGRHTLDTANIPLLNNIINLPFGGRSPFTAEVWYVNKVYSLDIKWGTPTPIQLQDPIYKVFIPLRSFGQFGIQIEDSRKFLIKLVGTLTHLNKEHITRFFRGLYLTKIKDSLASYLVHKKISVLEINAYLVELSNYIQEKIAPVLNEYGIKLVNFYINDINVPEDDAAVVKLKQALAKRAEMDIVGYSYAQERSFDTLEGAATNPGAAQAGIMGAGLGLGMGVGIGGGIGQQMGTMAQNITTEADTKTCPQCKNRSDSKQRFCGQCGYDTNMPAHQQDVGEILCGNCGKEFSKSVKFCPYCGDPYNPCSKCHSDVKSGSAICHVCGSSMPLPCPNCGELIEQQQSKYCSQCGTSLYKKCPGCNSELKGNLKFCSECGMKL